MLIDFENTGYISLCPSPDIIPVEDKNTYIPSSTWGYIRGDISEQSDLMDLLANIENGLTADQIGLLVNADSRLNTVEQDIAALEVSHDHDITHINSEISTKANAVDVYTKSEIDSKHYLTEHQDLSDYATMNWVYSKNYLSQETDPIWLAEKHKYALKSELPSTAGYAKESWVNEQLVAKADITDIYTKIEIDGKNYATQRWTNEQLLAKADLSDIYTKIEIDGKNYATQDWTAEQLLGKASLSDTYTKAEIDGKRYATEIWTAEQLTATAKLSDVYTKAEIDGFNYTTEDWTNEQLLAKANTTDVYTKNEIDAKSYITSPYLTEQLTAYAKLTDTYTKIEIDGKNYATQDWTAEQLVAKANTSDVWSKTEMMSGMLDKDDIKIEGYLTYADLTGYATEEWVTEQGYITADDSVDLHYTKEEVDTAITNVEDNFPNYYTKEEVDTAIADAEVDLTGYATEAWCAERYVTRHVEGLLYYYRKTQIDEMMSKKLDTNKIWTGTEEEWDVLSADEQNSYIIAMIEIE